MIKRADLSKIMDLSTELHDLETMVVGIDAALGKMRDQTAKTGTPQALCLHAYTTTEADNRVGDVALTLKGNAAWNALTDLKRHINLEIDKKRTTLNVQYGVEG